EKNDKEKPPVGAGDLIETYMLSIETHVAHEMQKKTCYSRSKVRVFRERIQLIHHSNRKK
ncbi:hypothetical protein P4306_20765, partial [Bacillus thuringiensis]|nr:hypothetical protein [Bacillus thuringiensis]